MKINATKKEKGSVMKFVLGKNGRYKPNGLGNRLIVMVRQADNETKFLHFIMFLKFNNFITMHI